ncbi:MAG: methylated-DNA--[protein]-cysteine S-methyltransferase, partial [Methylocella sp.]
EVERVRDSIVAYLRGEPGDLSSVLLDMDLVPPFHRRVYAAARGIPRGATMTYGALAARAGDAGSARAVGQALARNPFALIVPCHRVVAAGGGIGGFSANGGIAAKLRLLAIEGHHQGAPRLFDGPRVAAQSRRKGKPALA